MESRPIWSKNQCHLGQQEDKQTSGQTGRQGGMKAEEWQIHEQVQIDKEGKVRKSGNKMVKASYVCLKTAAQEDIYNERGKTTQGQKPSCKMEIWQGIRRQKI